MPESATHAALPPQNAGVAAGLWHFHRCCKSEWGQGLVTDGTAMAWWQGAERRSDLEAQGLFGSSRSNQEGWAVCNASKQKTSIHRWSKYSPSTDSGKAGRSTNSF